MRNISIFTYKSDDMFLLISDKHPDGTILSRNEYIRECKKMDRGDFECHIVTPIARESVQALAQSLLEVEYMDQPRKVYN